MKFRELTVEEMARGYTFSKERREYSCIFCGETFSEGRIYDKDDRLITAEQAVREHVLEAHDGAFGGLINLERQVSGLTDVQKNVLSGMYRQISNNDIGLEMGISSATVRTHKFNIQKMKREARILLAVLENIENEELRAEREHLTAMMEDRKRDRDYHEESPVERSVTGNSLHPFFTQFYLK